MTTPTLNIAPNLSLPLEAVTETFAILAIRGVGKTHTASVMAEEMMKAGQPVCIYDPTGAWFGLKTSKDGKHPGFPVVIFGGEHADVPLEETAGALIARVLVERRISAILDVSLLRKGARVRFMTAFLEELYHRNREPLHLFLDEAHSIAPQNLRAFPEAAPLVGALEDIVLQGRRRGLGVTAISQRPALLNTNIRTQCGTVIVMRIIGPHDRKAILEWVEAHASEEKAKTMLDSLATLKKGEGWVWSPAWLDIFKRVKFRDRETFDSSATPKVGQRTVMPKVFAEIDLQALGEEIAATVAKQKADDPKALRADIADLKRQLAAKPDVPATVETIDREALLATQQAELARIVDINRKYLQDRLGKGIEECIAATVAAGATLGRFLTVLQNDQGWSPPELSIHAREAIGKAIVKAPVKPQVIKLQGREVVGIGMVTSHATSEPPGERRLTGTSLRIGQVAAAYGSAGIRRDLLAAMLGHSNGGSFAARISEARTAGAIVVDNGVVRPTEEGQRWLAGQFTAPTTTEEVMEVWSHKLRPGSVQRRMIDYLIEQNREVPRTELAEALGLSNGGSFAARLSEVRSTGLIRTEHGTVAADREKLFL